ncbi:MAG TPA: hypothetical protein VN158_08390, partial [Caulobacter sp.]|nr:hypothetical protein [Caulobacter sp.]
IGGVGDKNLMLFGDRATSGFADRAGQGGRHRPVRIVLHRLPGPFEYQDREFSPQKFDVLEMAVRHRSILAAGGLLGTMQARQKAGRPRGGSIPIPT